MRHRNLRMKLRGTPSHRRAMYSNMLASLVAHGRIETTEQRAKALRRIAEKAVTRATSLGDLLLKDRSKLVAEDKARLIHAIRLVSRNLRNREAVLRLFDDVAPRYLGRPGGYTRVFKKGFRKGDGASIALLEFIEAEMPEREGAARSEDSKKKGRFGWRGRNKGEKDGQEKQPDKSAP